MSRPRFSAVLFLLLSLQAAGCGAGLAAGIQNPDMVVLPDPDLSKAARFPAGAATAGVAHIGPALDDVDIRARGCSPRNPCALPTPAGPDDAAAQPARQRLSKNRRLRHAG
ncbi:MAG TPA: hypothetical protein VFA87_06970 [Rhizomicrobium sp.]|nr:hypothetical protein [Rhizomicrobium sp.]